MSDPRASTPPTPIERIVIVGGGSSGWMCAAALSRMVPADRVAITLIESDDIGVIGVGEATIPTLTKFNHFLGIDEDAFVRATSGTFKLGIEFVDWRKVGERYFHPFGNNGRDTEDFTFHQLYLKLRHMAGDDPALREQYGDLSDYNMSAVAARLGRFSRPSGGPSSVLSSISHAYHFDAGRYGQFLRRYAEARGVRRLEGRIVSVQQRPEDGFLESLTLADGRAIPGDLFIDCSGFRGLLIEQTLKAGFEDWSRYLPCDRALAVPCAAVSEPTPYTRSTADEAGWRWRIPLQHRVGNGHVYCSGFIDDDRARRHLLAGLDGKALDEPRPIRFTTGHRKAFWVKNCVAIGLAGGFIEPLESTSIHLVQRGVARLVRLFPDKGFDSAEIAQFNRESITEYEELRDFIVLHYKANERDEPFWRYCREMEAPASLAHKIELFRSKGRVFRLQEELFSENSWMSVMLGQGVIPRGYDALVDKIPEETLVKNLAHLKGAMLRAAESLPTHRAFIEKNCAA
jgi:tryptophan halogenase